MKSAGFSGRNLYTPFLLLPALLLAARTGASVKKKVKMKKGENKKTEDFIKLYFGNNAINTNELCEMLPIYI